MVLVLCGRSRFRASRSPRQHPNSTLSPGVRRVANAACNRAGDRARAARTVLSARTAGAWPALVPYPNWKLTCDTLHAHTQTLGKLAVALAPPQPQLQHAALRLTVRGWETLPLPAPDGSGSIAVRLDLHLHQAMVEHSDGRNARVALMPNRSVGQVTREILQAVRALAGTVEIDPKPQEVPWTVRLDEDSEHATYDQAAVESYFASATRAAQVLTEFRAPYRGRSTPVNAWWGSFDLAVSLFSGAPATPPSEDFIMRNAMDAQEVAVGWWPGDERHPEPAFYAYAHPAPRDFKSGSISPAAARWDDSLGEFVLDWDHIQSSSDPHRLAVEFARSVFMHACAVCDWDPVLAATIQGKPRPVR